MMSSRLVPATPWSYTRSVAPAMIRARVSEPRAVRRAVPRWIFVAMTAAYDQLDLIVQFCVMNMDQSVQFRASERNTVSRLHNGQHFPSLSLPAVGGGTVSLPDDLAGSFGVVLIYRGSWCPYCN